MRKRTKREPTRTRAEWARLVDEWRRSGETALVFCGQRKLKVGSLTAWATMLKRSSSETGDERGRPSPARLVPVVLGQPERSPGVSTEGAAWELVLPNGARLRVHRELTESETAGLIRVLTSAKGKST